MTVHNKSSKTININDCTVAELIFVTINNKGTLFYLYEKQVVTCSFLSLVTGSNVYLSKCMAHEVRRIHSLKKMD